MLPLNAIKRFAKENGCKRISWETVEYLKDFLENQAKEVIKRGIIVMDNEKRTTLLKRDIDTALDLGISFVTKKNR